MSDFGSNAHIPFEVICRDRKYYVPKITEGHPILMEIINWCIDRYNLDHSIKTYMCYKGCKTDGECDFANDSFIMFNIPYNKEDYIYSILNSVNSLSGTKYMMGQQRIDNTILLDVKRSYLNEERANEFFIKIRDALNRADKVKFSSPEIENMVKILKEVRLINYSLIFQKNIKYSVLYSTAISTSIVDRGCEKEEKFTKDEIIKLKSNHFVNSRL
jgi:hypothetical protein